VDLVETPIQEQPSLGELLGKIVGFLFTNSRPQFHSALYVLVYAAFWVGLMQIALFLISLTPWFSLVLDFDLIGTFVGCTGLAELSRGHVKHWLGYSAEDWCYVAMPIGGAVLGAAFAGLMFLMWGMSTWYEPALFVLGGAGFYTLLGWLLHLQKKQKSNQIESES
jgi:hypothetical protein